MPIFRSIIILPCFRIFSLGKVYAAYSYGGGGGGVIVDGSGPEASQYQGQGYGGGGLGYNDWDGLQGVILLEVDSK